MKLPSCSSAIDMAASAVEAGRDSARCMTSISHDVSARLSGPPTCPTRIREPCFGAGQRELKCSAAWLVRLRPQLAPMSMNDGAANRQPHARSTGLRGVEGVEDSIEMRRINARAGIAHGHEDACLALLGANQQLPCPRLYRLHCFSRIQDEIQQDLLQLDAIPVNRKQSISKLFMDRNAFPVGYALPQYKHLIDRRIEIEALFSRRRFLHLLSDAIDDVSGSIRIANDTGERLLDLAQVRRWHPQKILSCPSVVACAGDRLCNFV